MISARVIADSVNPDGVRLTTVEATFNRYILAELNTHRMLSRNSASSRAIPVKKIMSAVWRNPATPVAWGANQAGMQAKKNLAGLRAWAARRMFLWARIPALVVVWILTKLGLHKQITNRLLEPWMWQTAIISATEWNNFYKLRCHPDAQPEFQVLANCIRTAIRSSRPQALAWGDWHLPYADKVENNEIGAKISAACCARVSYVRQNERKGLDEDIAFSDRLAVNGHYSPLEHPAQAVRGFKGGNFAAGWKQLRKNYENEDGVAPIIHDQLRLG